MTERTCCVSPVSPPSRSARRPGGLACPCTSSPPPTLRLRRPSCKSPRTASSTTPERRDERRHADKTRADSGGARSGDRSGTGYPGARRPFGVDQAAGAALDLVVRADRGRPDHRPRCRDRGVRGAVQDLGRQFRRGRGDDQPGRHLVRSAGARRARHPAVQRRIRHRDDPRHAGRGAVPAAGAVAEFFTATALESSRGGSAISLTDPGVLREVAGASLYLTVIAVIGLALGALLRRTAAGLSVFAAVFLVVPLVTAYLPQSIQGFAPYLPSNAGGTIWGAGKLFGGHQLGPWAGFAVLCGYAVVLTGLAAWRLQRRDA